MSERDAVVRPTVRVLLLDDAGRALLFRMVGQDGVAFWFPPGGAVEDGETHETAAMRELTEETGWSSPRVGPEIGRRRHVFEWGEATLDCRERWFLSRVDRLDIDTTGFTEEERALVLEHRWWTPRELAETSARLVPSTLAELVEQVLSRGAPEEPLALPV